MDTQAKLTSPIVMIGVPAYQNERTLRRAVASIQAQSIGNFTAFLSDDCSDDATFEICQEFAAEDDRFTAVRQPENQGFLHFGAVLRSAQTQYFVWLAGDDWWEPTFLEKTIAVLESNPKAVSALPKCAFIGSGLSDPPDTTSLTGPWAKRAAAFLASPNGTRMYGLHRTAALKKAFPEKVMNAYDWFLLLGLLRQGSQLEVPETLLQREKTDWQSYSRMVDQIYPPGMHRRYPLLDMSLSALRAGIVPLRLSVLKQLHRLNHLKHDEYKLVVRPKDYFQTVPKTPASKAAHHDLAPATASVAYDMLTSEETPSEETAAALSVLEHLAQGGNAEAQFNLARYLSKYDGNLATIHSNFRAAKRKGIAGAAFELTQHEAEQGLISQQDLCDRFYASAKAGEARAVVLLAKAYCDGALTGISPTQLAALLETDAVDHCGNLARARAKLISETSQCPKVLERAIEGLAHAAEINPFARRDRGAILLQLQREDEATKDLFRAARSGAVWALYDLATVTDIEQTPEFLRMTHDLRKEGRSANLLATIENRLVKQARRADAPAIKRALYQNPQKSLVSARRVPKITALLAVRNAGPRITRILDHFANQNIPVVLIDHGSTDDTWAQAMPFRDKSIIGMHREPYLGYFDLTRQLQFKRDLIQQMDCDWVVHSDADEFVETYDGAPLAEFLHRYQDTPVQAISCDEFAFLPTSEDETHDPHSFPDTMRDYVNLSERDPKQRVFRKDCVLDLWMETGGHTITRDPSELATDPLRLRHYVGLSLDDLRAQYLPRVFSGQDRVKTWHGGRFGQGDFIQPTDKSLFFNIDRDGWKTGQELTNLPVLARTHQLPHRLVHSDEIPETTRLIIVSVDPDVSTQASALLADRLPPGSVHVMDANDDALQAVGTTPILHVLSLPEDLQRAAIKADCITWVRSISYIRQTVLIGPRRFAEFRIEDVADDPDLLTDCVDQLLFQPLAPVAHFKRYTARPDISVCENLRAIGSDFLRDLGYMPTPGPWT